MWWVVGAGVAAFLAVRRYRRGPTLERVSWLLYRNPKGASFREVGTGRVPSLRELLAPLERFGYRPELAAPEGSDHLGVGVIRHEGRRHGGVSVDLRLLQERGVGSVEAASTGDGFYEEMAKYVIYALGQIAPGMAFRGSFSSLTPESTDTLEPQLPHRPRGL